MQILQKQNYKEVTLLIVDDDDIDAIALERALRKLRLLNTVLRARDGEFIKTHANPFIVKVMPQRAAG